MIDEIVPAHYRDPDGHWFGISLRARVVYASKERVKQDAITYEELADPKWKGKICIRSGQHPYNIALIAACRPGRRGQGRGMAEGREGQPRPEALGRRPRVARDILAGVCDIGVGNTYYIGADAATTRPRAEGLGRRGQGDPRRPSPAAAPT